MPYGELMHPADTVEWTLRRLEGVDHATLQSSEELRRIAALDPKLWAALSCPTAGLECDARMLELMDTDNDGRIRIPEIVAAVEYVCACLREPSIIVEPGSALPLATLRTDTPEGRRLAETARTMLESLGKEHAVSLSREDVSTAAADAAKQDMNGDGIVPPLESLDEMVRAFIRDALAVTGGVRDAGGLQGINRAVADAFVTTLRQWREWKEALDAAASPLGPDTVEAWNLLRELKNKIDDYFLRCELAAFVPSSAEALTLCSGAPGTEAGHAPAHGLLDREHLADLPLAGIGVDRPLQTSGGLNPAWRERTERFFFLINPLLGTAGSLSRTDWQSVQAVFAPYAEALSRRPEPVLPEPGPAADGLSGPTATPEELGLERVREILDSDVARRFAALADRDAAAPAAAADIAAMERMVLYYLHLHRLLMNFVSFYEFYSMRGNAVFQAGILYMDGRECRLCLPVGNVEKHVALAAYSQLCLLYCDCRRTERDGSERSARIVAAMTAGDADLLFQGRKGVFVDTAGKDWDATLTRIVSNPISLRQAVWQPYTRFGRMVSGQIAKLGGSRQDSPNTPAVQHSEADDTQPLLPQNFDIGRSVGIFAAIGLGFGAIGTAVASIASAMFSLRWWQLPLVFIGLFLLISGPSLVVAWLKLRKRALGPLLEASGWAVNCRLPINLSLSGALTGMIALPPNVLRCTKDSLKKPECRIGLALLSAAVGIVLVWFWFHPPLPGALPGSGK